MTINPEEDDLLEEYPVTYSIDSAILMHRDAHFGGKFDFMLDYYKNEGKGVCSDFDINSIEKLAKMESEMQQNIAAVLLSGAEAEQVSKARDAYKQLKELYTQPHKKNNYPLLIADLILSEEEYPEKEINAIVSEKGAIVPALIDLLRAENFNDPLFPGYGMAPSLAAKCLGLIADKRSLIALFETIGCQDFFEEDVVLEALKSIGEPAKEFLLKVLQGRPINQDNERAAIALVKFKDDPKVIQTALNFLKNPDIRKDIPLATYLTLICEGIEQTNFKEEFIALIEDPLTPKDLRFDMKAIVKGWKTKE